MDRKKEITLRVGQRLRYFREMKGLSQEKLALEADMNPAFLGHLERGLKCPTVATLDKIVSVLGITLSELLDFDNDAKNQSEKALERISLAVRNLPDDKLNHLADAIDSILKMCK